jgi:hypothetical protein
MSTTGMFIKTADEYPPNSRIRVEFTADNHLVQVDARVMWARNVPQNLFHLVEKRHGVRFLRFPGPVKSTSAVPREKHEHRWLVSEVMRFWENGR